MQLIGRQPQIPRPLVQIPVVQPNFKLLTMGGNFGNDLPQNQQKHRIYVFKSKYVQTSKHPTTSTNNTAGNPQPAQPPSGPEAIIESALSCSPDSPNCAALLYQKQRHPQSPALHCYHGVIKFKTQMRPKGAMKFFTDITSMVPQIVGCTSQTGRAADDGSTWTMMVALPNHHNFNKVASLLGLKTGPGGVRDWLPSIPTRVLFGTLLEGDGLAIGAPIVHGLSGNGCMSAGDGTSGEGNGGQAKVDTLDEIKELIDNHGASLDDIRENYFKEYLRHKGSLSMEITQRRELELHLCTLRYDQLVPWQKKIVDMCGTTPHPRMVYWVVDEEGGRGKSVLCKYLMENYAAFVSGEEARYQVWVNCIRLA